MPESGTRDGHVPVDISISSVSPLPLFSHLVCAICPQEVLYSYLMPVSISAAFPTEGGMYFHLLPREVGIHFYLLPRTE